MKELFMRNVYNKKVFSNFFDLHHINRIIIVFKKILFKKIFFSLLFTFLSGVLFAQIYHIAVKNVILNPPINPVIKDYVNSGKLSVMISNDTATSRNVYLFGTITRTSPAPFTISLKPNAKIDPTFIMQNSTLPLSPPQILSAFGNFDLANLDVSVDPAVITDPNNPANIKLPDGTYTMCFYARSDIGCSVNCALSNPNLGCSAPFTIVSCSQPVSGVQINTIIKPPVNPIFAQALMTPGTIVPVLQFNNPVGCNARVKVFGKILSPSFTITLNPQLVPPSTVTLIAGVPTQLNSKQVMDAFGGFTPGNLISTGIDLATITDANGRIKLPDDNYRVCFYARYVNSDGLLEDYASDPNLGCGTFTICNKAGGAPQFIQPVSSNLNINSDISVVQPASPVIFTWIPPQSTCGLPPGGFTYDFEIRELLLNQNVNDAINNPYVFRKTGLPSTTFILDTNLNKNILHTGGKYAIRVRAVNSNPNSTVEIDNNGYSRIEAFQYGGNLISYNDVHHEPEDYHIPFNERKTDFWNDVYASYKKHARGDTLVPIDEYIAFALTQNGTAYNDDAIDLFLALNPELANLKTVKISYTPQLPVFPDVSANDKQSFAQEHSKNLEPDNAEKNKFLNYLDTLNTYRHNISDTAGLIINDIYGYLNNIKPQVGSIDQVTVNVINEVLSELLYEARRYSKSINKNQYQQLQSLSAALRDLTAESVNTTSFLYTFPSKKESSLSSYQSNTGKHGIKISLENNVLKFNGDSIQRVSAVIMKQLLPFDIIVWRNNTAAPFKPVLDAPDLTATYRVFYTLSTLYNHKNPEINAKSTSHLASTVQVSLPSNCVFTFWTLNMRNHKMTKAEDVDLKDILSSMNKVSSQLKKPSIVLKVN